MEARMSGRRDPKNDPPAVWRLLRRNNPRAVRAFESGRGRRLGLVLTTTGRRTGLPRKTPLQYEELDGVIYVGSARGEQADWYRNLVAEPAVVMQIGSDCFTARAHPLRRPDEILAFLRLRLRRHPWMIRMMLLMHGLPPWSGERALRRLAERLAVVALRDRQRLTQPGAPQNDEEAGNA
jgi:deazaflavin-dependent oxidoreductase (nitroreductase family)